MTAREKLLEDRLKLAEARAREPEVRALDVIANALAAQGLGRSGALVEQRHERRLESVRDFLGERLRIEREVPLGSESLGLAHENLIRSLRGILFRHSPRLLGGLEEDWSRAMGDSLPDQMLQRHSRDLQALLDQALQAADILRQERGLGIPSAASSASTSTDASERQLEQKFRILYSASQEGPDFDTWIAEAQSVDGYSVAVLFVDVDDFKAVNTRFTESVVDRTILPELQALVRRLCLHRGAAYRHGGEELVVLLPNCELDEAMRFAEKLRAQVAAHVFLVDGHFFPITLSIGVAVWPLHGGSFEIVLEEANRAEREAKNAGKNCVRIARP